MAHYFKECCWMELRYRSYYISKCRYNQA
uniref:Uncharacterized protein n=1 Tax=Rhizophora mucronata TaxID=61149 RepID=A0A2P2NVJ3_RHIMU